MKGRALALLSVLAVVAGPAVGGAPAGARKATGPPASGPAKTLRIGAVQVDLVERQVSLDAEVCLREGVLEFLLVSWQTKTHESILHTHAKPSHLHAALLMLGLRPGKPARWSGEDESARFLPPAGAELAIDLLWKDRRGKARRSPAGAWLRGAEGRKITQPDRWIFVGSQVLPDGAYWAELDGEVISVTNFASAVIDVPFRSSNANDLRELFANTGAIPPLGTKVRVILTALPGAEKAPHARALLDIDRFGRTRIDNKTLTGEQLQKWAEKYIQRHEKGMVVIRAAGKALVHDVANARLNLRLGGVREFDVQRVPPRTEVLPRTVEQAKRSLEEWDEKFANARELIREPGQQAQRVLDQIELHLRATDARREMLKEYAAHLRKALSRYQASTQPASGGE